MMDYESLVTLGQQAAEEENRIYWILGTYALAVKSLPGRTLKAFGADIGKSGSALSEYSCVTEYYLTEDTTLQECIATLKAHLCYTLFRDAKKLGDIEQSVTFLERCLGELWSVDKARGILKDILAGQPIMETWTVWDGIDLDNLSARDIASHVEQHIRALRQEGHQVRIKIYGVGERIMV